MAKNKDQISSTADSDINPLYTGVPAPSETAGAPVDIERILAENEALKATQSAQQAQNDQVLDALIEMREKMEQLEAGQSSQPAPPAFDEEAKLNAEWAALREEFKDVPNIEVLDHRVQFGADASSSIRLEAAPAGMPEPTFQEDPRGERCYWQLRWFNFGVTGRAERFVNEGYLKVERTELQDQDSIPNMTADGLHVRIGERGQEVLGKIPRKIYQFKKRRDAARAGRLMTSESGLRDRLSNQVASMAGATGGNADRAGSFVNSKGFSLTIKKGEKESFTA